MTLGPQLRMLLAALVVAEGKPLPRGRLADLLWP
jgi:DNA-binding SARP family transcriptional activator